MHTLTTSSGQPFRPNHVIAVNGSGTGRRVVMDTGEVLTDHWPTAIEAKIFTLRVKYAMDGLDLLDCKPAWATVENAEKAQAECVAAGATNGEEVFYLVLAGIGEPPSCVLARRVPRGDRLREDIAAAVKDGTVSNRLIRYVRGIMAAERDSPHADREAIAAEVFGACGLAEHGEVEGEHGTAWVICEASDWGYLEGDQPTAPG